VDGESNGVGKDHQGVPRLGEPCVSQNPRDTLEKLTKEEFLKGRAEEARARRRGDAIAKTRGLWRMMRSPFLRATRTTKTKATGRNMLPANAVRTIRR